MSTRIIKAFTLTILCAIYAAGIQAQDARVKSADNEFIMEIYREPTDVRLVFYFTDASKYSYLIIEKEEGDGQFRQCAYIDLRTQDSYGGAIEAKDNYPTSPLNDCQYRVRTVTTDRIERIYPPLRLPAAKADSHEGK